MHRATADHSPNDPDVELAARPTRSGTGRWMVMLVGPLVLLAVVVALVVVTDPVASLGGGAVPVEEDLAVESVRLSPDLIEISVRNVSSTDVTLAQVLVNEAYWNHQVDDRELARLESTQVTIRYPWNEGLPLHLSFLTATGVRVDHDIPVALVSPPRDAGTMGRFAGLGLLIGVVPVAIGLLWYPALRRLSDRVRLAVLGFTAGLLAFLLVDTLEEALHVAGQAGGALNAVGLVAVGATAMVAVLVLVADVVAGRDGTEAPMVRGGLVTAYVLALAIGLHNLGEGLAVATAITVGEVALGTSLLLGFILHNSTEGLAIAMPLGVRTHVRGSHFAGLALVAGIPAAVGTVAGSWSVAPAWAALAFGAAAGALAQVLWVLRPPLIDARDHRGAVILGFTVGLVLMYATGLFTA